MKKRVYLAGIALSLLATPLASCVQSVTCLDHVDEDGNGICDHCGEKVEPKKVSNISKLTISKLPTKTYYAMGEALDVTGGEMTVTYKDGTPDKVMALTDEGVKISAPNMTSKGQKMVGVSYEGKNTSFQIEVGDKKFTVSFNLGYDGAPEIESQSVVIKTNATAPDNPTRDGYDFGGWFADPSCTIPFDFAAREIMEDTIVYAKWFKQYTITYSLNYEGATEVITRKTYLGKVVNDVDTPQRDGFAFAGWFKETTCVTPFDFNTDIKEDTTIYAKWVADSVTFYNVTFNTNYGEEPTKSVVQVAEGNSVSRPVDPSRANVTDPGHVAKDFTFRGWFTDEACTTLYDFNSEVIGDIELFAGWNGQYIFEAEHVDLVDANGDPLQGMGASGGSVGANMVDSPAPSAMGIDASNGYYVTYLYAPFLTITFNITSDRAVSDAKLTFRVTCEKMGYALSPTMNGGQTDNGTNISNYTINVNDEALIYDMVEVTYNAADYTATDGWRPFSDFVLTTSLNLKKGDNKLDFISSNANGMGGTMAATAPVIDCLKIDTSAELSWDPVLGNEFGQ